MSKQMSGTGQYYDYYERKMKSVDEWTQQVLKEQAEKEKAALQNHYIQKQQPESSYDEDVIDIPKKYFLTNDVKEVSDDKGRMYKVHRIVAAHDIPGVGVRKGDLGGYVESYKNLAHRGTCWIFDGCVFGQALVKDGATVRGEGVRVYDNATLSDGFTAYDSVKLHGNFRGSGCAKACKYADCSDNSIQTGSSYVTGFTMMRGNAKVCDNARAEGNTSMSGTAEFHGDYVSISGFYTYSVLGKTPAKTPSGR